LQYALLTYYDCNMFIEQGHCILGAPMIPSPHTAKGSKEPIQK
jgi:hypothetical protein